MDPVTDEFRHGARIVASSSCAAYVPVDVLAIQRKSIDGSGEYIMTEPVLLYWLHNKLLSDNGCGDVKTADEITTEIDSNPTKWG